MKARWKTENDRGTSKTNENLNENINYSVSGYHFDRNKHVYFVERGYSNFWTYRE